MSFIKEIGIEVVVHHLSFSVVINKKLKPILKDISFKVAAGSFIAIMGSSGSGKR